jgi:hypothetical protein
LVQQVGQGIPGAFIALVAFWLTLLFASFGLFAPRKLMSAVVLVLCALAVAGAIGLILDMEGPFTGLVRISPLPMRAAVNALNQ